ncbi:MAG: hypothetical protein Q8M24_06730 [Pseudolabrys sp.]|nr:hypothetical protein [Pseudolabrys sp.]MDP2295144.1 hypothetical protein [Pseudolabrys sp.]
MAEAEGMELWAAVGEVTAGDVAVCAKAGAASTVASAAAVNVRFIMDKSSWVRVLKSNTLKRRVSRHIKKERGTCAPRSKNDKGFECDAAAQVNPRR